MTESRLAGANCGNHPAIAAVEICTRCGRSGTGMTTIEVGGHRWRYCGHCSGRADKTTIARPVTCAHPYLRTALDGDGYACIDCFEPQPGPPLVAEDLEQGHAVLSLVIPVLLFGGMLLALATASGKLRYLVEHLPLPEPGLNGWPLFVLTVGGIGLWWRLSKIRTTVHELDVALFNEPPPADEWWFDTSPFTDTAPAPVRRRRSNPDPALDLPPDAAELDPTILPRRRSGWRS